MGYNGGTNKRGYYRRNNGMYSKSSSRYGEKLISNLLTGVIVGGFGLLKAGADAFSETLSNANDNSSLAISPALKHYNPSIGKAKSIIFGTLSMLCPIVGCMVYVYADWWMSISIFIFGTITLLLMCYGWTEISIDDKYVYDDEIECTRSRCKQIYKIHIGFSIIAVLLNLYPFIIIVRMIHYNRWGLLDAEISGFSLFLAVVNLLVLLLLVILAILDYKSLDKVFLRQTRSRNIESEIKKTDADMKEINERQIEMKAMENVPVQDIDFHAEFMSDKELHKFNGHYYEDLFERTFTLWVSADTAYINVKSSYRLRIDESEIDNYIQAYNVNLEKAKEMQKKVQELHVKELRLDGEYKMNISVSEDSFTIYVDHYELPIRTEEECYEIIKQLHFMKMRIAEIRNKIFM